MIRSFRHRGLKRRLEEGGDGGGLGNYCKTAASSLDALDRRVRPEDMDAHGFGFHALRGKPKRYAVHFNAPVAADLRVGQWRSLSRRF